MTYNLLHKRYTPFMQQVMRVKTTVIQNGIQYISAA